MERSPCSLILLRSLTRVGEEHDKSVTKGLAPLDKRKKCCPLACQVADCKPHLPEREHTASWRTLATVLFNLISSQVSQFQWSELRSISLLAPLATGSSVQSWASKLEEKHPNHPWALYQFPKNTWASSTQFFCKPGFYLWDTDLTILLLRCDLNKTKQSMEI